MNVKHIVIAALGGFAFGALLGVAGVSITTPSYYPLILMYSIVQSIAIGRIFGASR